MYRIRFWNVKGYDNWGIPEYEVLQQEVDDDMLEYLLQVVPEDLIQDIEEI